LVFNVSLAAPLRELPWGEIDGILARLDPRLERVLIRVLPADGPDLRFDEFAEFLKEQMVSLERRQLLRFEHCGL
jgi:hypothetical protein